MPTVVLHPKKEQRVYSGHPWVFRSDIDRVEGPCQDGDVVRVVSSRGRFLAMAVYNPRSQISLRILSRKEEPIDSAFIHRQVKTAIDYRRTFADLNSCRLLFAESDGLPCRHRRQIRRYRSAAGAVPRHGAVQAGHRGRAGGGSPPRRYL